MREQHEASVAKLKKQKDRIRLEKRSLATTKKQIENLKEEIRYALAHSQVAQFLYDQTNILLELQASCMQSGNIMQEVCMKSLSD